MAVTANRRISATITLQANGRTQVSVFLVEADGKRTLLSIPPLPHPEALEGFIYALAAQHGVAPEAIEIAVDDQASAPRPQAPASNRIH